jgi:hypothetical protein
MFQIKSLPFIFWVRVPRKWRQKPKKRHLSTKLHSVIQGGGGGGDDDSNNIDNHTTMEEPTVF